MTNSRRGPSVQRIAQRVSLLVCLLVIGGFSGPAGAATIDSAKVAAVEKAAREFLALAKDSYKTGQPPRQTDPAVAALLDTVFNTAGVNDGPPVPISEIGKLNKWLLRTIFVGSVYVFAGTGIQDPTQVKTIDQKQHRQVAKNTIAFAPELGRYFDAEIDLEHALIDAIDAAIKADPERYQSKKSQGGLAKLKAGVKRTLRGGLSVFQTSDVTSAWKRERLRPLLSIAPSAARTLAAEDRRELAEMARELVTRNDDAKVKSGLETFAKTLSP